MDNISSQSVEICLKILCKLEEESISMHLIRCNQALYEYDIQALFKSFYPEEEARVVADTSVVKDKSLFDAVPFAKITYEETGMKIEFPEDGEAGIYQLNWQKKAKVSNVEQNNDSHTNVDQMGMNQADADRKKACKQFIYTCLVKRTGRTLPWGNLTGIRPTKIAMGMLDEGKNEEQIAAFMRETHMVSEEKITLGIEIAKREQALLKTLHYEAGYSLYIGIPFCPTTCLYCSFTSFPVSAWKERVTDYLTALEKEMNYTADVYRNKVLDTVYIGGGTPSSLSAGELDRLLSKLTKTFDMSRVQEFTVEAGRADSITPEKLKVLYEYGVTRISVNPQSMKQETLDYIGRRHTVEQVKEAFLWARKAGFENINMDIILGLPKETAADVANTMAAITDLGPDALTVHSLAVKRASKLSQWITENGIEFLTNTEETMRIAEKGARDMGMVPYYLYRQKNMSGNFENVGYAKEGKYGIYNILIMEEKQTIVALGAGSISKRVYSDGRIERCENVKEVAQYIERIDEMIERKRRLLESD